HLHLLKEKYPHHQEKVHILKEFTANDPHLNHAFLTELNISDPFGQDLATYRATLSELETHINQLIKKLDTGDSGYGEKTSLKLTEKISAVHYDSCFNNLYYIRNFHLCDLRFSKGQY